MSTMTKDVEILKLDLSAEQAQKETDAVAREEVLHVFLGSIHFVSIMCSPSSLKELVVGHMLGEGLIQSINEIISLDFHGEDRCRVNLRKTNVEDHFVASKPFARLIVSACGDVRYRSISELLDKIELKPLPSWQVPAKTVGECVRKLNFLAETFRKTGGVHAAALFSRRGKLITLAEDVGRHNAVDKAIGAASLSHRDLGQCFLTLSGRLTGDIVLKAARAGIPILASLAAAVSSGVEVASKADVTLAGFVRGKRMNVYSGPQRIKL